MRQSPPKVNGDMPLVYMHVLTKEFVLPAKLFVLIIIDANDDLGDLGGLAAPDDDLVGPAHDLVHCLH